MASIDENQVADLRVIGMSWKDIANRLGVSTRTLHRHRQCFANPSGYIDISDDHLDAKVEEIVSQCPKMGEKMITGALRSKGINVQRQRIRESIHRVNPNPTGFKRKITRRKYCVPHPNFVWHQDGNHKLIKWKLVVHGCVDGHSRMICFLKCSDNNKSNTVLQLFLEATESYRVPLKIRTDHGTENVGVARFMLNHHGVASNPVITGKSVHNQRIERLWVDVFSCVLQKFYNLFTVLEESDQLNINNDQELYALHYVFIPRINKSLFDFQQYWNNHPLRTEGNRSPLQLWTEGLYDHPELLEVTEMQNNDSDISSDVDEEDIEEIETDNHIVIPRLDVNIPDETIEILQERFDPLQEDNNNGIDIYLNVIDFLNQ